jgi:hypothetical protein
MRLRGVPYRILSLSHCYPVGRRIAESTARSTEYMAWYETRRECPPSRPDPAIDGRKLFQEYLERMSDNITY